MTSGALEINPVLRMEHTIGDSVRKVMGATVTFAEGQLEGVVSHAESTASPEVITDAVEDEQNSPDFPRLLQNAARVAQLTRNFRESHRDNRQSTIGGAGISGELSQFPDALKAISRSGLRAGEHSDDPIK